MAFVPTVNNVNVTGNMKTVSGSFTSVAGDNVLTLDNSVHGLNHITFAHADLDEYAIGTQTPKMSISSGTLTLTWQDTLGASGVFYIVGR